MREIKFRAWDKNNRDMIYEEILLPIQRVKKMMAYTHNYQIYKFMQFTGLTDKNGKEIYEGDLIKYDNTIYQIIFGLGWCAFADSRQGINDIGGNIVGFYLKDANEKDNHEAFTNGEYYEIIGNIYENPELLNNATLKLGESLRT